jgi:hypothetical protein
MLAGEFVLRSLWLPYRWTRHGQWVWMSPSWNVRLPTSSSQTICSPKPQCGSRPRAARLYTWRGQAARTISPYGQSHRLESHRRRGVVKLPARTCRRAMSSGNKGPRSSASQPLRRHASIRGTPILIRAQSFDAHTARRAADLSSCIIAHRPIGTAGRSSDGLATRSSSR